MKKPKETIIIPAFKDSNGDWLLIDKQFISAVHTLEHIESWMKQHAHLYKHGFKLFEFKAKKEVQFPPKKDKNGVKNKKGRKGIEI